MIHNEPKQPARILGNVKRTLDVLAYLGRCPSGASMKHLHENLEIPFATIHRLLGTLEHEGWVVRKPENKKYFIGPEAKKSLGGPVNDKQITLPPQQLIDAASETGETMFLTGLYGDAIICTSMVESSHALRLFVRMGQAVPVLSAASSRSILAYQDASFLDDIIRPSLYLYDSSVSDHLLSQFVERLKVIRERGYDISDNELDEHVWAVSAPIANISGQVDSAVTMAAAASRMEAAEDRRKAIETVVTVATYLSESNYQTSPHGSFEELWPHRSRISQKD